MNSPLTTEDFADDVLVRFESQTIDPVVDDEDSDDDDEHAELGFDNVEYMTEQMLAWQEMQPSISSFTSCVIPGHHTDCLSWCNINSLPR